MVDPLATKLAEHIQTASASYDAVNNWPVQQLDNITFGVPYGEDINHDPYRLLPPTMFGEQGERLQRRMPGRRYSQQKLITAFIREYVTRMNEKTDITITSLTQEGWLEELPDSLRTLEGARIDPLRWQRYVRGAQQQMAGRQFHLELAAAYREGNIHALGNLAQDVLRTVWTGRFEQHQYRSTSMLRPRRGRLMDAGAAFIFAPEGEYGADFSTALLKTTLYAVDLADATLGSQAARLAEGHEVTIQHHMARGHQDSKEKRTPDEALVAAVQEGAATVAQVWSGMTAERVAGYDDPVDLVEALTRQGLVEEFTRAVPMGMVGPMTLAGMYFPGLVQHVGGGELRLNPDTMRVIKQARTQQVALYATRWAAYREALQQHDEDAESPEVTGLICPAAFPGGGVAQLARAMAQALRSCVEGRGYAPTKH